MEAAKGGSRPLPPQSMECPVRLPTAGRQVATEGHGHRLPKRELGTKAGAETEESQVTGK